MLALPYGSHGYVLLREGKFIDLAKFPPSVIRQAARAVGPCRQLEHRRFYEKEARLTLLLRRTPPWLRAALLRARGLDLTRRRRPRCPCFVLVPAAQRPVDVLGKRRVVVMAFEDVVAIATVRFFDDTPTPARQNSDGNEGSRCSLAAFHSEPATPVSTPARRRRHLRPSREQLKQQEVNTSYRRRSCGIATLK